MMQRWGRFVGRTAWFWMLFWPVLALCVYLPAPRIPTLLEDDDTGFIPADRPSQRAFARLKEEFPDHAPASRAIIVFGRETGLSPADHALIAECGEALTARSADSSWHVRTAATAPHLRSILESDDGKAAVIAVDLPAEMLTHSTVNRVRAIRDVVAGARRDSRTSGTEDSRTSGRRASRTGGRTSGPPGLQVEITGNAAIGELLDRNAKRDVAKTTVWAFAAVMIILLGIYRSPVAMLLPLATIAISLAVSLGLIGFAASSFLPINGLVEMFVIVIVVGSGVDYCLFLFARFREEMTRTPDVGAAVHVAVARSGAAILASAGTNVVGLGTLILADNRDLCTSGPTIAFAVCIATFAVLTLAPSLMRVAGRRLFWPGGRDLHRTAAQGGGLWGFVSRIATRRPGAVAIGLIVLMLPPAILGGGVEPLYDSLEEFPADSSFVRGARLYGKHFAKDVSELTLIISAPVRLDAPQVLPTLRRALDTLADALSDRFPVSYQRDLHDPLGTLRPREGAKEAGIVGRLGAGLMDSMARDYYLGRSGRATRIDLGIGVEPRSREAIEMVPAIRQAVTRALAPTGLADALGPSTMRVDLAGEASLYADMHDLRRRDFRVIAIVAISLIFLILVGLIRSPAQAAVLVGATLLTYLAAYGTTWLVFHLWFGLEGLSHQVNFLLFIIILSLGQDYNIYVVTRIREELATLPPREAVATAIRRTGGVVSSCGIIMAAAFGSMLAGSLLVMKEMAVALAVGILIDTFLVRPLLVPSLILLLHSRDGEGR